MQLGGDAFSTNPLIKIAFADDNLTFDFKHPRKEIAGRALMEFMLQVKGTSLFLQNK